MKNFLSFIIAAVLLFSLCACADGDKNSAFVYRENKKVAASMSKSMYSLWLSYQKSLYSFMAKDETAWDKKVSEKPDSPTLSEFVKSQSNDSAKKLIVGSYLFDKEKALALTGSQKDEINSQVNDFMKNLSFTTVAQLDEYLSAFGANSKTLTEYYTLIKKYDLLFNYLYGENGIQKVTEDEIKDYFENNYAIVEHIFINTGTATKSDGTSVKLSQEEVETQTALANEIYNRVIAGEDFKELQKEYSQDVYGLTLYPEGFHVTKNSSYTAEFENAALTMQPGEIKRVESTQNGTVIGIHIMKKLPMDKEKYNVYEDTVTEITTSLSGEKFNAYLSEYTENVEENTSITELFDMKLISSLS